MSARRGSRRSSRSGGRSSWTREGHRGQARTARTRPRSLYASLRPVNGRRSRGDRTATSAADNDNNGGHSLLDLINSSRHMTHLLR